MTASCLLYDGKPLVLAGYAVLYNTPARVEDGVIEVFRRGAFRAALERGARLVSANWNHNSTFRWASVAAGTLALWEDSTGLAFEGTVDATPFGLGLARYVAEGAGGVSVLFVPCNSQRTPAGQVIERAYLKDICITASPTYPTGCWLGHSASNDLPPYARSLREKWLDGRAAHLAARVRSSPSARAVRSNPHGRASVSLQSAAPDWAMPPRGWLRHEWIAFGRAEAAGRRAHEAEQRRRRNRRQSELAP